jgi:hypothetical protein
VDTQRTIEELTGFEGRWAGSDAERRAAGYLGERLEELDREVEIEPTSVRPNYPVTHVVHAVLAIVGSVLSVGVPALGAALVLLAVISTFGDLTGTFYIARRLVGRRASQNVVSREGGEKAGTLILVAHYDAARTGAAFGPRLSERRAVIGKLIRRPIGPWDPFFWSMVIVLVASLLRIIGIEGLPLTVVQFVFTVVLIASVPLLADIALSGAVPGANDNASGVATVLRLAERHGGKLEHFDLWVLFTGAQEPIFQGMRSFLKRHQREMPRDRTIFLNVDQVGHGTVRWATKEGNVLAYKYHPSLLPICEDIAEDDEDDHYGARAYVSRSAGDGHPARTSGYPAVSITTLNAIDYSPHHHLPSDTPDHVDAEALERAYGFCSELIDRIDHQIGPEVAVPKNEVTVLAEGDEA